MLVQNLRKVPQISVQLLALQAWLVLARSISNMKLKKTMKPIEAKIDNVESKVTNVESKLEAKIDKVDNVSYDKNT